MLQMTVCPVSRVNGGDIATGTDLYTKYNWPGTADFWGVTDEELGIDTTAPEKALTTKTLGDYTYSVEMNNVLPNPFVEDGVKEVGCFQICLQEWGSALVAQHVDKMEVLDTDGNVLIAFDELGKKIEDTATEEPEEPAQSEEPAESETPAEPEAPTTGDSSKPSTNTGAEGIAVVAGVAVLAAGAAVIAKKRK